MASIAQCPTCSTRFRVVPDQLKISQGWVRCGKCGEVFDARSSASLRDVVGGLTNPGPSTGGRAPMPPQPSQVSIILRQVSDEGPEPIAVSADSPPPSPVAQLPAPVTPPEPVESAPDVALDAIPRFILAASERDAGSTPEPPVDSGAVTDSTPVPTAGAWPAETVPAEPVANTAIPPAEWTEVPREPSIQPLEPTAEREPTPVSPPMAVPASEPLPTVGFMRSARRKAVWRHPMVRLGLWFAALLLTLTLMIQVFWHQRDLLAAWRPGWRPWIVRLCEPIGCTPQPVRQIESLSIARTDLTRTQPGVYRFELVLRNQASIPLAVPAVMLALTDRQDDTLVSRVILPTDWASLVDDLRPAGDTVLQLSLRLNADGLESTEGFRAEIFYP